VRVKTLSTSDSTLNQKLHFHDLRYTHETWLIEDRIPRIMRLMRLGHKRKDVNDICSHVTDQVLDDTPAALHSRSEQDDGWPWQENSAVERKVA